MKFGVEYIERDGDVHFFRFGSKTSYLGKFDPKNLNCLFRMKMVPRITQIC